MRALRLIKVPATLTKRSQSRRYSVVPFFLVKSLMWASVITAYLHYLSLGLIFASLSTELFTLKQDLTNKDA